MRHAAFTCLVESADRSQNQVFSFGAGKRGQLGISKDKVKSVGLPQVTCGFEDVEIVSISANGDHSAALSGHGDLYIWGRGFPGTSDVVAPLCLISSSRFVKVALGWNHALGLSVDGGVFILGGDRHGALCNLDKISSLKNLNDLTHTGLQRVSNIEGVKVVEIAAGAEHSAVLTADGAIMTWGWGEHGQLGLGNTSDYTHPQPVTLGGKAVNQDVISRVYCGSGFTFTTRSPHLVRPPDLIL